jgi:hypothetical protein
MANTGYSNSNYLDLGYEVNIHGGSDVLADDRTRAVKLSEIYNDIKNYVEANIDLQLQVVNVPTTQTKPRLSVLGDKRTFKLDVPESAISVDDVAVNITSDQIKDPDPAGYGITNQKGYNEYSLERITWLVKWSERADDAAVYSADPSDPVDNALTAVLDNWNVTAQLPHPNIGLKDEAINKFDGLYLMDLIEDVDIKVDNTRSFIYALYQANQFNRYCIKVDDGTGTILPNPGELVYQQEKYKDQTLILINELSYSNTYLEVDYNDGNDPDIPNAYGVFNNKEDVVINIDGRIYHVGDDQANPDDTITRIVDGDNAYYEFVVYGNVEDEDAVDSGNDTQSVGVYKTSPDVNTLLQDYMKKDGKLANGMDDHFRGEIDFRAGLNLSGDNSYIKLKFDKGQKGEVLTSQGDETPVWTNIEEIYVKKSGDTMTGDLKFENSGINTEVTADAVEDGEGNPVWDSTVDRFNVIKTNAPKIILDDGTQPDDFSSEWGIKFDIDAGDSGKNRVKVSNRYGDIVQVAGGTGPQINFGKPEDANGDPTHPNANGDAWKSSFFEGDEAGVKILGIPTPSADAPDDIAVNKGYVDAAVSGSSVVEGGCIELNGGNLCAGDPHPSYMDTIVNSSLVKLDERPDIDGGHVNNRVFEQSNEIYRTSKSVNNRTKTIYKTNYKDGTHEHVGNFYDSSFYNSDYRERSDIKEGTVSFDRKYLVCGETWGGYGGYSTDSSRTQYIYRKDISTPEIAQDSSRYFKRVQVVYGRSNNHRCQSMLSTGPRPDSKNGYMIGAFFHYGNYNSSAQYSSKLVIYNYEKNEVYDRFTSNLFNNNSSPFVWEGNPEYDEYFATCSTSSSNYVPVVKIKLTDVYNQIETEKLFTDLNDTIHSITYLHKSKRYYLGGYKKGYLTKPYDGPLDDKALNGAIIFDLPSYTTPSFTGNTATIKLYNSLNRAFEFGDEIVVEGNRSTKTVYETGNTSNKKTFEIPKGIGILKGGESEFKIYYSSVSTDPDFDGFGEGTSFTFSQAVPHIYFQHKFQSPSQLYGDESTATPNDADFLTPGFTQPYSQPIYWNGIQIGMESNESQVERHPQTFGINSYVSTQVAYSQSDIYDGNVYRLRNGSPASSSFNGAFLTNGWIKANVDSDLPSDAVDIRINDLSGKWYNQDSTISNNRDREVTTNGTVTTFNNVKGVSVTFDDTSILDNSYNKFTVVAPNAVRAMVEHNDTGLGPLE